MMYKGVNMLKFGYVPSCPGANQPGYIADAWKDIPMQGHAEHFVNGEAGLTWACAMSNMAKDPENQRLFPHPIREAFFTGKTVCYIMTGEKQGGHFIYIKYVHGFGIQLDLNDAHLSQMLAKESPEVFEAEFLLRIPPKSKRRIKTTRANKRASSPRKPTGIPKGSVARALAGGLITAAEARDLVKSMDLYERQRLASISRKK